MGTKRREVALSLRKDASVIQWSRSDEKVESLKMSNTSYFDISSYINVSSGCLANLIVFLAGVFTLSMEGLLVYPNDYVSAAR